MFDRAKVTSVDWATYPILRFGHAPDIRIELIDRPTEPPLGAGEASCVLRAGCARQRGVTTRPVVRLRTVPFTARAGEDRARATRLDHCVTQGMPTGRLR
jgi:CO/xanthine dehydrogenase Mo-binding subunit